MRHIVIPEFTSSNEGTDPHSEMRGPPRLWFNPNKVHSVGKVKAGGAEEEPPKSFPVLIV